MIKERRRKINEANRSLSSVFWFRAFVMDGGGDGTKAGKNIFMAFRWDLGFIVERPNYG